MVKEIQNSGRTVPKVIQTTTNETLDQLERRLELFRAKLDAIQPIVTAVEGRYRAIQDTISTLQERVDLMRQGQLNLEASNGDA